MSKKTCAAITIVRNTLTLYLLGASLAFAQPQVDIEYISSFGSFGKTKAGTFESPVGVVVDSTGRLLIPDNDNDRVQRCDIQGNCEIIGGRGTQLGQFIWPAGVALDSLGQMFVTEAGNDRVQFRNIQGAWSLLGSDFDLPAGITVDEQDRIIIADENKHRIQICSTGGGCTVFGTRGSGLGQFRRPRGVAVDDQHLILVSEWDNHRIQTCDYAGSCTTAFGSHGQAPGQFDFPCELTLDNRGYIIITDRDNNRIQICERTGACMAYGEFGSGPGQFNHPVGVAVDSQDRIYIADRDNNRIQIFQATYADEPAPFVINAGLNDAWYYPPTSGQGFFITVFSELGVVSLAWFTYDTELPPDGVTANLGDPGHRWLTALGPIDGNNAVLNIEMTSNGLFDSPADIESRDDGTIILSFENCTTGTVEYDIPSINRKGTVPIVRVANDNSALCEALSEP